MSTTTTINYATVPTTLLRAIATSIYTPEYRERIITFTDIPPGVTPHFEAAPNGRGIAYIVVGVVLQIISTLVVGMRFYARTVLSRALGWDDCWCLAASVGWHSQN